MKQQFIAQKVKKPISYCVTCDNWTDNTSQTCLGVTVLSEYWLEVHNENIGVCPMDEFDIADNLAES